MKRNLLAVMFMTVLLCAGVHAQQIFIPQPPALYIPLLDPVRMHIMNEVVRNTTNAAQGPVGDQKGSTNKIATADDITVFTRAGNIIYLNLWRRL